MDYAKLKELYLLLLDYRDGVLERIRIFSDTYLQGQGHDTFVPLSTFYVFAPLYKELVCIDYLTGVLGDILEKGENNASEE